jgi:hypothetical protein
MKLQARFVQLPVQYDAQLLAKEVEAFPADAWLPHPQNFAGNDFLPLISANGDERNDSFVGRMLPTEHLKASPYIVDVLASLGASLGRSRLMRLSGHAEVTPHVDVNYYWRDRMRVHVPIITQPTVSFHCGDKQVHMAAGECWIFDTWSRHKVINDAERSRVHLVVDTVGGAGFWKLASAARLPDAPAPPNWRPTLIRPNGANIERLEFETQNLPQVMSPWEVSNHIDFLLSEALPNQPNLQQVMQLAMRFKHVWRAIWSTHGEDKAGWPQYRAALDEFSAGLKMAQATRVRLRNNADLFLALFTLVIEPGLADRQRDNGAGEQRLDLGGPAPAEADPPRTTRSAAGEQDPLFDRPIFIVNPPRSGSSLLFETLAHSPTLFTIGGESHGLIEGIPELGMPARQWSSNRLDAADAAPDVILELRRRFAASLRDRQGRGAPAGARVRMLEKTPKNALRIPFLQAAFPEARFVYLYRDPREVLASMMEAWESGRFNTYPTLPGWNGKLPWSLLLTPGWRDLAPLPLNEIVARQWTAATQILLDDLEQIPQERRFVARYDALVADPVAEVTRLAGLLDFTWDRALRGDLPLSAHTVSKPREDKWRAREAEVSAVLPIIRDVAERAERAVAR